MTIRLSDLRVTPTGKRHDRARPAPHWGSDFVADPTHWATWFVDPAIEAVGPHRGVALLNVTGTPGVSITLDAAVTNDGYSSGPLAWLMPTLHHQGKPKVKLCLEPLSSSDLYPEHLTEDGEVIASPDSTHANNADFINDLAARVCTLFNEHLATLTSLVMDVPEVPDWQRDETIGTVTVKARWDAAGRLPSTVKTATSVAAAFGLTSLTAGSTIYDQAVAFGAGLAELAPELDISDPGASCDGCFVEISGPTTALPPAARCYLNWLTHDPDIDVDLTIDGAAILHH